MQTKKLILEKISQILNSKINSEAKALYLLAEIRKVLSEKKTLLIFCNWTLHNKLSHPPTIRYFIEKFEPYIKDDSEVETIANELKTKQSDFFKLYELKAELQQFFTKNNLPSQLTDDPKLWVLFSKLLLEIMSECSVIIEKEKIKELSLIKDNFGNTCYRFHLRNNRRMIKIKLKFKS